MIESRGRGDNANRFPGGESPAATARRREPIGISRLAKFRISSAALRNPSAARITSILASVSGFPPSCAMLRANASSLSDNSTAARIEMDTAAGERFLQGGR